MNTFQRTSYYTFHGLRVAIEASQAVREILDARLRQFRDKQHDHVHIRFVFHLLPDAAEHVVQVPQQTRIVYESPQGQVLYAEAEDRLYLTHQEYITAGCDPENGLVQVSIKQPELERLWLISHPVFTLPFLECLKRRGVYSVHAAGLCLDGKAIVVPGASGSGKSTLSIALTRAGFTFLGDDMLFLAAGQESIRVLAFPDEIDITDHTGKLFPELHPLLQQPKLLGWPKRQFLVEDMYAGAFTAECQPRLLIFPKIAHAEQSVITPMDEGEALLTLASNVLLTAPEPSQGHLSMLAELVRTSKCYSLATGHDFDVLPQTLHALLLD